MIDTYCISASLSQTPHSFPCVSDMFESSKQTLNAHLSYCENTTCILTLPHTLKPAMNTQGMSGQHIQRDSDSSRWLYFEGLGIGLGRLT